MRSTVDIADVLPVSIVARAVDARIFLFRVSKSSLFLTAISISSYFGFAICQFIFSYEALSTKCATSSNLIVIHSSPFSKSCKLQKSAFKRETLPSRRAAAMSSRPTKRIKRDHDSHFDVSLWVLWVLRVISGCICFIVEFYFY